MISLRTFTYVIVLGRAIETSKALVYENTVITDLT